MPKRPDDDDPRSPGPRRSFGERRPRPGDPGTPRGADSRRGSPPRGGGERQGSRSAGGDDRRRKPDGPSARGGAGSGSQERGRSGAARPDEGPPRRTGGGRPGKPVSGPRELPAAGRGWGGLARKGTQNLGERKWEGADHADRPDPVPPEAWEPEQWVEHPRPKEEATPPSRRRPPRPVPPPVAAELQRVVGPDRAPRLASRLADAVRAFERDHFDEARQLLQPVADEAPTAPSVRELLGLTFYRLGRWRQAVRELEAFAELSSSTASAPILADAYRALGRHDRVEELWEEIRVASEDPAVVTEGRIVAAGSLADQDRLADAIALLEKGRLSVKRPEDHHLRLWYALADLYERVGEVPRARDLFERVARHDPGMVDVVARRRALG